MSLKWAGVPDRCQHGKYEDQDCVHCHVTRLQAENEQLRVELVHLQRKIDHGCANFYCSECDTPQQIEGYTASDPMDV